MIKLAAVLAFLTACGDGKTETDRCTATVTKIMGKGPSGDSWARKSDDEKKRVLAMREKVNTAVIESCRTLKWSTEMHDCVDKAEDSKAGLRACEELLTADQTSAVDAAMKSSK